MKKISIFSGIIALSLVALYSCNKLVYKYNANFEGNWFTDRVYDQNLNDSVRSQIFMDSKSNGKFNNTCLNECLPDLCDCISKQAGKSEMNAGNTQLKVGSAKGAQPLTINKEPYQDSTGKWKMEINSLIYTKQ